MADIVIYGAEPAGVAAALTAARRAAAGTTVTLLFPESAPGGGCTAGALGTWERRQWTHGGRRDDPQGGSFADWLAETGPVYSPEGFAARLASALADAGVRVLPSREIIGVHGAAPAAGGARGRSRSRRGKAGAAPAAIEALRVCPLVPGDDGVPALDADGAEDLAGAVFVDASATGRLSRLAGMRQSVGRADYNPDGRQMAASLLFAVERVDWDALVAARDANDKAIWGTASDEGPDGPRRSFWGGGTIAASDAVLAAFAAAHTGFRVGAPRAFEDRDGRFWLSALLVYNVDGRRRAYDAGTDRETEALPLLSLDVDAAYREARSLVGSSDLLGALRRFPGLAEARVAESGGRPLCAEALLLRESAHSMGPGVDGFAVRVEDLTGAGLGPHDGLDERHRARRVGLGFYWLESLGYTPGEGLRTTAAAGNPAYLPLDAVLAPPVTNLLVPGYAARIESRAWWALRTAPNQCVLGDAAGMAAAFSAREGIPPLRFGNAEVAAIQHWLAADGAILDKW